MNLVNQIHDPVDHWAALLAALDEMETVSQADHPDETVQWAINELSDEGLAYLFGPQRKVIDAYKAWKKANKELNNDSHK